MAATIDFESSNEFFRLLLDNVPQEIVVIDAQGFIKFANKSWSAYGEENNCLIQHWLGVNYLAECQKAAIRGDSFGIKASQGIQEVISKEKQTFSFEYPCECPKKVFWFTMHVSPIIHGNDNYYIISHYDITERKLAEQKVLKLSKLDPLTSIPNRRNIDGFLAAEWRRCARESKTLSYALIDIDHFKLINDTYGHQTGDQCLIKVANELRHISSRPGDICGRYGGEEFAVIWSGISSAQAQLLAQKLLKQVQKLEIPNEQSPDNKHLTISIGVATMIPTPDTPQQTIIKHADELLYHAKKQGRNQIAAKSFQKEYACET